LGGALLLAAPDIAMAAWRDFAVRLRGLAQGIDGVVVQGRTCWLSDWGTRIGLGPSGTLMTTPLPASESNQEKAQSILKEIQAAGGLSVSLSIGLRQEVPVHAASLALLHFEALHSELRLHHLRLNVSRAAMRFSLQWSAVADFLNFVMALREMEEASAAGSAHAATTLPSTSVAAALSSPIDPDKPPNIPVIRAGILCIREQLTTVHNMLMMLGLQSFHEVRSVAWALARRRTTYADLRHWAGHAYTWAVEPEMATVPGDALNGGLPRAYANRMFADNIPRINGTEEPVKPVLDKAPPVPSRSLHEVSCHNWVCSFRLERQHAWLQLLALLGTPHAINPATAVQHERGAFGDFVRSYATVACPEFQLPPPGASPSEVAAIMQSAAWQACTRPRPALGSLPFDSPPFADQWHAVARESAQARLVAAAMRESKSTVPASVAANRGWPTPEDIDARAQQLEQSIADALASGAHLEKGQTAEEAELAMRAAAYHAATEEFAKEFNAYATQQCKYATGYCNDVEWQDRPYALKKLSDPERVFMTSTLIQLVTMHRRMWDDEYRVTVGSADDGGGTTDKLAVYQYMHMNAARMLEALHPPDTPGLTPDDVAFSRVLYELLPILWTMYGPAYVSVATLWQGTRKSAPSIPIATDEYSAVAKGSALLAEINKSASADGTVAAPATQVLADKDNPATPVSGPAPTAEPGAAVGKGKKGKKGSSEPAVQTPTKPVAAAPAPAAAAAINGAASADAPAVHSSSGSDIKGELHGNGASVTAATILSWLDIAPVHEAHAALMRLVMEADTVAARPLMPVLHPLSGSMAVAADRKTGASVTASKLQPSTAMVTKQPATPSSPAVDSDGPPEPMGSPSATPDDADAASPSPDTAAGAANSASRNANAGGRGLIRTGQPEDDAQSSAARLIVLHRALRGAAALVWTRANELRSRLAAIGIRISPTGEGPDLGNPSVAQNLPRGAAWFQPPIVMGEDEATARNAASTPSGSAGGSGGGGGTPASGAASSPSASTPLNDTLQQLAGYSLRLVGSEDAAFASRYVLEDPVTLERFVLGQADSALPPPRADDRAIVPAGSTSGAAVISGNTSGDLPQAPVPFDVRDPRIAESHTALEQAYASHGSKASSAENLASVAKSNISGIASYETTYAARLSSIPSRAKAGPHDASQDSFGAAPLRGWAQPLGVPLTSREHAVLGHLLVTNLRHAAKDMLVTARRHPWLPRIAAATAVSHSPLMLGEELTDDALAILGSRYNEYRSVRSDWCDVPRTMAALWLNSSLEAQKQQVVYMSKEHMKKLLRFPRLPGSPPFEAVCQSVRSRKDAARLAPLSGVTPPPLANPAAASPAANALAAYAAAAHPNAPSTMLAHLEASAEAYYRVEWPAPSRALQTSLLPLDVLTARELTADGSLDDFEHVHRYPGRRRPTNDEDEDTAMIVAAAGAVSARPGTVAPSAAAITAAANAPKKPPFGPPHDFVGEAIAAEDLASGLADVAQYLDEVAIFMLPLTKAWYLVANALAVAPYRATTRDLCGQAPGAGAYIQLVARDLLADELQQRRRELALFELEEAETTDERRKAEAKAALAKAKERERQAKEKAAADALAAQKAKQEAEAAARKPITASTPIAASLSPEDEAAAANRAVIARQEAALAAAKAAAVTTTSSGGGSSPSSSPPAAVAAATAAQTDGWSAVGAKPEAGKKAKASPDAATPVKPKSAAPSPDAGGGSKPKAQLATTTAPAPAPAPSAASATTTPVKGRTASTTGPAPAAAASGTSSASASTPTKVTAAPPQAPPQTQASKAAAAAAAAAAATPDKGKGATSTTQLTKSSAAKDVALSVAAAGKGAGGQTPAKTAAASTPAAGKGTNTNPAATNATASQRAKATTPAKGNTGASPATPGGKSEVAAWQTPQSQKKQQKQKGTESTTAPPGLPAAATPAGLATVPNGQVETSNGSPTVPVVPAPAPAGIPGAVSRGISVSSSGSAPRNVFKPERGVSPLTHSQAQADVTLPAAVVRSPSPPAVQAWQQQPQPQLQAQAGYAMPQPQPNPVVAPPAPPAWMAPLMGLLRGKAVAYIKAVHRVRFVGMSIFGSNATEMVRAALLPLDSDATALAAWITSNAPQLAFLLNPQYQPSAAELSLTYEAMRLAAEHCINSDLLRLSVKDTECGQMVEDVRLPPLEILLQSLNLTLGPVTPPTPAPLPLPMPPQMPLASNFNNFGVPDSSILLQPSGTVQDHTMSMLPLTQPLQLTGPSALHFGASEADAIYQPGLSGGSAAPLAVSDGSGLNPQAVSWSMPVPAAPASSPVSMPAPAPAPAPALAPEPASLWGSGGLGGGIPTASFASKLGSGGGGGWAAVAAGTGAGSASILGGEDLVSGGFIADEPDPFMAGILAAVEDTSTHAALGMGLGFDDIVDKGLTEPAWEESGGRNKNRGRGRKTSSPTDNGVESSDVGLGNRYGENNCFLNVTVQVLFRLRAFRLGFTDKFKKMYASAKDRLPQGQAGFSARSAFELLSALNTTLTTMAAAASKRGGEGQGLRSVSLNSLRKALYNALLAREVAKADAKAEATVVDSKRLLSPAGLAAANTARTGQTRSSAPTTAMIRDIAETSMGDASEAQEEIITLIHEAEAAVTALLAGAGGGGAGRRGSPTASVMPFSAALELPLTPTVSSSVALTTFGMLVADSTKCGACNFASLPASFTGLAQHINTNELIRARSLAAAALAGATPVFGYLLRILIEGASEHRSCEICGHRPLQVLRRLLRPSPVLTLVLGWVSPAEPVQQVRAVLDAVDMYVDLATMFHGLADVGGSTSSTMMLPARLRSMVCYVNNHWVAFFDLSPPGFSTTMAQWVCCNDERVFEVASPIAECLQHRLQPSMLFYESGQIGDAMPTDRGRGVLHGPIAALSLPVEVDSAIDLASSAFPALGASKSGGKPATVPASVTKSRLAAAQSKATDFRGPANTERVT
jgi:hypothetical protein